MLSRIDRYIARLILVPMIATLTIAAMLLLLEKMLTLFDFVINEGGPVSVVFQMLANLIPSYLGLGIPIGVLLGTMLAFRRLALNSELDALTSSGTSWLRLLKVPYLYAILMALMTFFLVGYVQPFTSYYYDSLRADLRSGALGASIKVGEFVSIGNGVTLRIDESRGGGTDLRGIFAHSRLKAGDISITAARGTFLRTDNPDIILFRLADGVLIQNDPALASPRQLRFKMHDLPINLPIIESFRNRGGAQEELTIGELLSRSADSAQAVKEQNAASANFWRRMIQVFIVFALPPLAIAFAVPPKRTTSAIGIFLAIVILVSYNEFSETMERLGASGKVEPVLAQGGPFVLFILFGFAMFSILAFKVGGQPLAFFTRIAKPFGALSSLLLAPIRKLLASKRVSVGA
jgi:lipopolysaccharide export system permease protein